MASSTEDDWNNLISDLYCAALDPAAAVRLPHTLARVLGGGSAALWSVNPTTGGLAGPMLTDMPDEARLLYAARYHKFDPWMSRFSAMSPNAVVRGSSLIPDADLARTTYYNEFGASLGTFHVIGGVLPLASVDECVFGAVAILRPREFGAFEDDEAIKLGRLLPHIRRALELGKQINGAVSTAYDAALDAMLEGLGVAAAVVDGHGRVLRANTAAERLASSEAGFRLGGRARLTRGSWRRSQAKRGACERRSLRWPEAEPERRS
jgi:PAS domain-containing protein